jgi:hypothetical protein
MTSSRRPRTPSITSSCACWTFHSLRPQETAWAAAIVLYEKQQVVTPPGDGPCRVTSHHLLSVGTPMDTYALLSGED